MDADLIIVGSGVGGASLASALAFSGLRILILERGERLQPSPEARDDVAIFQRGHFAPTEQWMGSDGTPFVAGNYYVVGGNSKFYGAVMYRFRKEDFRSRDHLEGSSPGWPLSYEDMEPWYTKAEILFRVRGIAKEDPTEPPHRSPYGFPPVPDEPVIQKVRERLLRAGRTLLHFRLPSILNSGWPKGLQVGMLSQIPARARLTRNRDPLQLPWQLQIFQS